MPKFCNDFLPYFGLTTALMAWGCCKAKTMQQFVRNSCTGQKVVWGYKKVVTTFGPGQKVVTIPPTPRAVSYNSI